jgi:hypothetical protein
MQAIKTDPEIHEPRGSQEGKYEKGIGFEGGRVFKHLGLT